MTGTRHTRIKAIVELPSGEERTWMIIQLLNSQGTWTIRDVAAFCGEPDQSINGYVTRLEKAGFIRRVGTVATVPGQRGRPTTIYEAVRRTPDAPRIAKDGSVEPERQTQRLWRAMRMLKEFSAPELAGYASDGDGGGKINVDSVATYCWALRRAGVLTDLGRVCRSGPKRYRLVRPLGPRAPQILRAKIVFDPNAKAALGVGESREGAR